MQPLSSTSCFLPHQTETGPCLPGFLVSFEAAYAAFPWHSRTHSLVHRVAQIVERAAAGVHRAPLKNVWRPGLFLLASVVVPMREVCCADGQVFVRLLTSVVVPTKEVCCSDALEPNAASMP